MIAKGFTDPTERIKKLKAEVVNAVPEVEAHRAVLITEAYKAAEGMPAVMKRAKACENIFNNLPVVIRDNELIVGALSVAPRSTNLCPEFSYDWVEKEFKTMATRMCDPFVIPEDVADTLHEVFKYWKGKTTSELATSYMSQECLDCQAGGVFTVGNYYFGGIGHVCVDYGKVLKVGFKGIIAEAAAKMDQLDRNDPEFLQKRNFYEAVIISYNAAINFAKRYSKKAAELAATCKDPVRKAELLQISRNCDRVPENGATNFWEACQSFWFVQALVQIEANGHSISPGRFDQYMWPYLEADKEISKEFAQELVDCIFVLLNHVNKTRDDVSDQAFAGYAVFQNLGVGGQDRFGMDATNPVSYMCMEAAAHVKLPAPSFSIRVHNGTPDEFLLRACELARLGMGVPAMYNDEAIIPALCGRGLTLPDARDYCIIGCVEPQCPHKTEGWHDAAFFNVAKVFDITIHGGKNRDGKQLGPVTPPMPEWKSMDDVYKNFETQIAYFVEKLVEADNAVDVAHAQRAPLPFMSALVEDCLGRGKTVMEGGAIYNFTGPQAFGNVDTGDAIYAIQKHVFEDKDLTMAEIYEAMENNFGAELGAGCYDGPFVKLSAAPDTAAADTCCVEKIDENDMEALINAIVKKVLAEKGDCVDLADTAAASKSCCCGISDAKRAEYDRIRQVLDATPCFGNDDDAPDMCARKATQIYSYEVEKYKNPRGGQYQAGCYPVSANVLFGKDVQALPDGRYSNAPLADGISPRQGHDVKGLVFNIQRFSVNDGPGVRSIVFLNGCPLRCKWCCNPESQELKPVVMFKAINCVGCGNCTVVCPTGASDLKLPGKIDHTKCIACGKCVDVCYHKALELSGKWMTVEDLMVELYKDRVVYRRSGGGITVSGGEALVQHEFLLELLKTCKSLGWHTAIETTGMASKAVIDKIVPWLDLVMMDIKQVDPKIHKAFTGVDSTPILENAIHISKIAKEMIVRVPVIPGFNADKKSIEAIAAFATHMHNIKEIHLLPYHDLGSNKYGMMGKEYELAGVKTPDKDIIEEFKQIVEKYGFQCKIGG